MSICSSLEKDLREFRKLMEQIAADEKMTPIQVKVLENFPVFHIRKISGAIEEKPENN